MGLFCPKCGTLMRPKKSGEKNSLVCNCGYVEKKPEPVKLSDSMAKKEKIQVVDKDETETLPMMEAECPKCGHKKAHYWLQQTRAGDEAETKFLKCEKCKHLWRDYD